MVRLCPFCLLPLVTECLCDDEPLPGDAPPYDCRTCQDTGHVCESHPGRPWGGFCCGGPAALGPDCDALCEHGACHCMSPGMPCRACCSPIAEAFTPDRPRGDKP